jgi:spore germination protein YaaH
VNVTIINRVFAVSALVLLVIVLGAGPLAAELDDPNSRYIRIERRISSDTTNVTPHLAIVREYADRRIPADVWVPGELLTQMKVPTKLNAAKTSFTLRVDKPAETIELPALAKLSPNAIDLEFRAKSEDGVLYFNLTGMEKVTGLSYAVTPGDMLTVGTLPLMSPYASGKAEIPKPQKPDGPFNLVWDHVIGDNADLTAEDPLPTVGVISPTWFALLDETGRVSNRADTSYTASAHLKGYRVWGLVSNGFNRARTKKFLADKKAQDLFIANMLTYAKIYALDGINIDFENVDNNDASRLTEFVRRFVTAGSPLGLEFSIDVAIPSKWSLCFQRAQLSGIVDYIAVMTYDEHWRSSPKAGSTASLPWVRSALGKTLAEVPADKLLMGIPFYTRVWEETKGKNGKTSVKSRALSMVSVDETIETTGAEKRWLAETGQNYLEYAQGDSKYRIWIEDEASIALRMELVKKHGLAGAAFWRKGFEKPRIWETVGGTPK